MEIIVCNKIDLISTLSADAGYILQHVQQKRIITLREYGKLNHRNHAGETIVTELLDIVINRGETACVEFANLLQEREIQATFPNLKQFISPASTSRVEDNPGKAADEITEYKMSSNPRGICLIINNRHFDSHKDRHGSMHDEESLKDVFQWLGYTLAVYRDQTAEQMEELLKTYSQKDHNGDCFVCCIMSHGSEKGVHGTDGAIISNDDIFGPFNGRSCPSLINKPKVFFIQACRGTEYHLPVTVQSDSYGDINAEMKDYEMLDINAVEMTTIPSFADFLVVRSTIKGYVSVRSTLEGTWFMQSLCGQLRKYCPKCVDVPTILLAVNQEVGEKAVKFQVSLVKQMPVYKVTLRKKLVFHVPKK